MDVFEQYVEYFKGSFCCQKSTFRKIWYQTLKEQVVDETTGTLYNIKLKKRRACGFKKCDVCSALEFAVMMAKGKDDRAKATNEYHKHLQQVKENRYACMYVCMYICMYACIHVCICIGLGYNRRG